MTPQEFKAWFDGFTEAFTTCPTKAQWTRIKARVAEIDGKPVTERVYVDRYWPSAMAYNGHPYLRPYWYSTCTSSAAGLASNATAQYQGQASAHNSISNNLSAIGGAVFNSMQAMSDLGRAEAKEIA